MYYGLFTNIPYSMLLKFGDTMTPRMLNKFFQSSVEKYYVSDFQQT